MSKRNIFTVMLSVVVFYFPVGANASSCEKEYISLDKAYLRAAVIFSGYAVDNPEKGITEFKVKELFKDSIRGSNFDPKELKYYSKTTSGDGWNPQHGFIPNVEYIFYAGYRNNEDDWYIGFSSCTRRHPIVEARMQQFREWGEDPSVLNEKTKSEPELIFRGKVVRRDISERLLTKYSSKQVKKAEVKFQIIEVFKSKDTGQNLEKIKMLSISSRECAEGYTLGQEYLVYASTYFIKDPKTKTKEIAFRDRCFPNYGTNFIGTKEYLRTLAESNKGSEK